MITFKKLVATNLFDLMFLDNFYNNIFVKSFPNKDECEDLDTIKKYMLKSSNSPYWDYEVILAFDDGVVIGGIIFDYMRSRNTAFIEFIAIDASYRTQRIGVRLFDFAMDVLNSKAKELGYVGIRYVFAEMDNPKYRGNDTMNYLYFNSKLGFRKLDIDYIQPPLIEGKEPVTTLWFIGINPSGGIFFDKDIVINSIHDFFSYSFDMEHVVHNEYYKSMISSIVPLTAIDSFPLIQEG